MKLTDLAPTPTTPEQVKHQMERLLAMWRRPPHWLPVDGIRYSSPKDLPTLSGQEWRTWETLLAECRVLAPRTASTGIKMHAALSGLSVDDLESQHAVLIRGTRSATRSRVLRDMAPALTGYRWSLQADLRNIGEHSELCRRIIRGRFLTILERDNLITFSEPIASCTDTVGPLLAAAATAVAPSFLDRLWRMACAMDVDYQFLALLPERARDTLGTRLSSELVAASNDLTFENDVILAAFSGGRDDPPIPRGFGGRHNDLPSSRFRDLVENEVALSRLRPELGDHYYDDLARASATLVTPSSLGHLLKSLPAGRTFAAALNAVVRFRPELVAHLIYDSRYQAEGALALERLPREIHDGPVHTYDLSEEWLKVQELGRSLLLTPSALQDFSSLVAFGIYDEERAPRRADPHVPSLSLTAAQRFSAWKGALTAPDGSASIFAVVQTHLSRRAGHSDSELIFSLRLLELALMTRSDWCVQLATGIVDAYSGDCSLAIASPHALSAHGDLLQTLRIVLSADGSEASSAWSRWLRPFDTASYLDHAKMEEDRLERGTGESSSSTYFAVGQVIRAHTESLVAQAARAPDGAAFEALLDAILDNYFADRKSALQVGVFWWHHLVTFTAREDTVVADPLFVRLGSVLSRTPRSASLLKRIINSTPEAHILAYLLLGLKGHVALQEILKTRLREQVTELLNGATGVALGHALEMANVLSQAEMARESERCARKVLEIVGARNDLSDYRSAAAVLLAASLAQQNSWEEILAMDPGQIRSPQSLVLKNFRAIALMELTRLIESRALYEEIIRSSPRDLMALTNLSACLLRMKHYEAALRAIEKARLLAQADNQEILDILTVNEIEAREQTGDRDGAERLRRTASDGVRSRMALSEDTQDSVVTSGGVAAASQSLLTHVDEVAPTPMMTPALPGQTVDVAIVTVLPEEYEAVKATLSGAAPAPKHPVYPDIFSWTTGTISRPGRAKPITIAVALVGQPGNVASSIATLRTLDRWKPRYLFFSGIAGGLERDGQVQGDLVISTEIWHYEYGKLDDGRFLPRLRYTHRADHGLVSKAQSYHSNTKAWTQCSAIAPRARHVPKLRFGVIGSGEKVIDDLSTDLVADVLKVRPDLQAIEMEGAGASAAIATAQSEGLAVGFVMVRGISDMPRRGPRWCRKRELRTNPGEQTAQRDRWKKYASVVSATFISSWLASPWGPELP